MQTRQLYIDPQIRLQIDNISIKIESSRNITNVSAIDPKVRLQMALASVCVYQLHIDQMSIKIECSRDITNVSAIYQKAYPFLSIIRNF